MCNHSYPALQHLSRYCLLAPQVLDATDPFERDVMAPFRMPVIDKYKEMGTIVMGKSEAGLVTVGDKLLVMPNKCACMAYRHRARAVKVSFCPWTGQDDVCIVRHNCCPQKALLHCLFESHHLQPYWDTQMLSTVSMEGLCMPMAWCGAAFYACRPAQK